VYAFLKGPAFFQSFIASDPNLNFDHHYAGRLAAQTVDSITGTPGTLFIAGRTSYYREGGILGFDSVLQAHAPASLKWQCIPYDKETHYSVQLKAFYDGLRFSHYGYSAKPPEFHPANGLLSTNSSFMVYSLNDNPSVHLTTDGSEPTPAASLMPRDTSFTITAPARVRVKTFGNRSSYVKEWTGNFSTGQLQPDLSANKKAPKGLAYKVFNGSWESFPDANSLTPSQSGVADSLVKLNALLQQRAAYLLIEGTVDITEEAAYIFYVNGFDAAELTLGGKTLWKEEGPDHNPSPSYIVSLKKGKYSLQLKLLHKTKALEPHFSVYRSRSGNDQWWENRVLDF
jgi:hypothetical protein